MTTCARDLAQRRALHWLCAGNLLGSRRFEESGSRLAKKAMAKFEYKVIPAPIRGEKLKGVKQPGVRFAQTVEGVLNMMAEDGWEFVRSEMLPSEERSGLSRTTKEWRNLLIFRRETITASQLDPLISEPTDRAETVKPTRPRNAPVIRAKEPETRTRVVARRVRSPADDAPAEEGQNEDATESPFEVRSVDDATEAGPFGKWRGRS